MKKVKRIYAAVLLAAVSLIGCQQAFAECGIASTYSSGSQTANGERYNHMGVSAAHKTLPFGTRVVVRNQRTGRSITVRMPPTFARRWLLPRLPDLHARHAALGEAAAVGVQPRIRLAVRHVRAGQHRGVERRARNPL